jgi:phosphate starvation-inducible PhoH-like protein
MSQTLQQDPLALHFQDARSLSELYCSDEAHLLLIEETLGINIITRDSWIQFHGASKQTRKAYTLFQALAKARSQGLKVRPTDIRYLLNLLKEDKADQIHGLLDSPMQLKIRNKTLVPKTFNQKLYLSAIPTHSITFGVGPAGTGKTYLAMATAIHSLLEGNHRKIILTRPAVEAGEALGYLPGDLQEKILPYLRPLYDAMEDMLGKTDTQKLIDRGLIEIAPLAYMRGRTLTNAFIILDEAQNTTPEQMMMFLTRLGEDSQMVITGDITQIDLPRSKQSGLTEAIRILRNIPQIHLFEFDKTDVVRHPVVQQILLAYEKEREQQNQS